MQSETRFIGILFGAVWTLVSFNIVVHIDMSFIVFFEGESFST